MYASRFVLVLLAIAGLSIAPAFGDGANGNLLTPGDYFDMESLGDPQLSPDGERIVYVRTWADVMTDRRYSNLWVASFDGKKIRPLTTGKRNDSAPRWSPQGDRVCFRSEDSDGNGQLFILWLDTLQTAKITNVVKGPANHAWSPDGVSIAFNSFVPGKKPKGVKMPDKPEGAKWAEPAQIIDRVTYRFDRRGYLPEGFQHIFVVPAGGGTARQVTSGDYDHSNPEWLDDETILFSGIRKPDWEWVTGDTETYAVNFSSGETKTLTDRYGPDSGPEPSPDGKWIAYTGYDEKRQSYTTTKLYKMAADGSNPELVSGDFDNDVRNVSWASDGKNLLFLAGYQGETHLYSSNLDGNIKQITDGSFQIRAFDASKGGRVAAVVDYPDHPDDLYTFTLSNPKPKRLTNVNDDILGHRELGELEEIWYKSSFDDRDVQGWIIKPPGFDPSTKYPLVLYIHGGPHGMYGVGFNFEFQTLASEGYVVLYTNPRGSTGYGQEFGNLIDKSYPGDDYFDLVSGVDAVVDRGYVDENHLYVTGGSGGGVLTCWVVGRTDRFRAAVSQYPVINWYSWIGTADIGYTVGWRWFDKWPWEDPMHYEKRSPISLVGNVTTPLLTITGEDDWRTPISESDQYYRALKIQKKEAKLVRIPNEAHGVAARPSHLIAKMLFIQDWFKQYSDDGETEEDETE